MNDFSVTIIANLKSLTVIASNIIGYFVRIIIACLCLEHCRLCKRELSLSLGQNSQNSQIEIGSCEYLHATKFESAIHTISKLVCIESTYPAIFTKLEGSFLAKKYSHCLCYECWIELEIGAPLIATFKLRNGIQSTLAIVSGAPYENKVRDLIGGLKYEGDLLLVTDLSFIMLNAWPALSERTPASNLVLVPVPLHKHRLRNRGFNQAELLARSLSKLTGIKKVSAIVRTVHTKPQQTLGRNERLKNVRGAFKAKGKLVRGKNVILVDDVCTSGATLIECAEELLKRGAASVAAVTVAGAIFWERQQEKDIA